MVDVDKRSNQIIVRNPEVPDEAPKLYTFDNVFGETSRQVEVYTETCEALVNSVLSGFNGTIFACLCYCFSTPITHYLFQMDKLVPARRLLLEGCRLVSLMNCFSFTAGRWRAMRQKMDVASSLARSIRCSRISQPAVEFVSLFFSL